MHRHISGGVPAVIYGLFGFDFWAILRLNHHLCLIYCFMYLLIKSIEMIFVQSRGGLKYRIGSFKGLFLKPRFWSMIFPTLDLIRVGSNILRTRFTRTFSGKVEVTQVRSISSYSENFPLKIEFWSKLKFFSGLRWPQYSDASLFSSIFLTKL